MSPKQTVRFRTPAKINFFLFVQKKREDGYHDLMMDLVPISLYDHIVISPNQGQGFKLVSSFKDVPAEENIVTKAVRLLEKTCKKGFSFDLELNKNIPSGAGLGGGSGNAAGVLVVLNQLFNLGIPLIKLQELSLTLGADVPFFIEPKPVHASGIGEHLSPLGAIEPIPILLLFPNFPISTAEAYKTCLVSRRNSGFWNYQSGDADTHRAELNDFWPHLSLKYPKLQFCQKKLRDSGAIVAGMSGSGSTLYGVYDSFEDRDRALRDTELSQGNQLYPVQTINHHSYL